MVKVMIVDDEILVRIGLRSTIAWEEAGFTVVADVSNGAQAIERFETADPDILITDIRMPGMNGMELIKVLKAKKRILKTVILTNYDNFEYAKQALDLDADEYLLKTALDNQTLLPILKKLQTKIEQEKAENLEYQQLQKNALRGLSFLKEHFCADFLTGKISSQEWWEFIKDLNLLWEDHCFQLVLIHSKTQTGNRIPTTLHTLPLVEDIAGKINSALVWEVTVNFEWVIVYNYALAEVTQYSKQIIPFNVRQIKSCLERYFQVQTLAVFGKSGLDYPQLPEEWSRLRRTADYRFFWPEKELFFNEDIPAVDFESFPLDLPRQNLKHFIRDCQREQIQTFLDELFAKVNRKLSPALLRQVWQELLGELFGLSRSCGVRMTEILQLEEKEGNCLEHFNSIVELKQWFYHKFELLMDQIQNQNSNKYSPPIRQAIQYIRENYPREIKLMVLAQQVGLSSNHFCTLFHLETGKSFLDYLHALRIEHAGELLAGSDFRVSEIAQKVGYRDAKYFSKVFQKYQNCSPSEYRQKNG